MWEDPDDSTNDAWGETAVVKKKGSYPTNIEDGTLVLICAVRNKFKSTSYVDEQESSEQWYYRAFPIATSGAVSNSNLNRFDYWHYAVCIDEKILLKQILLPIHLGTIIPIISHLES